MTKRQGSTKALIAKEKPEEEHHKPRQHYDADYAKEEKLKKGTS